MKKNIIKYQSLAHINIVVDNIEKATQFYQESLEASPVKYFPHFKNTGFAKSAGFMNAPEIVDVCIKILEIPTNPNPLVIELMKYHSPHGEDKRPMGNTNDIGGVRHVALNVINIDDVFKHLQSVDGVNMISSHPEYRPYQINAIQPTDFYFYNQSLENNQIEKENMCKIIGNIRYFYFIDPYGVQWEIEQII